MSALKPTPADAATTLPTLLQKAACERYRVSKHTIRRWCEELGVSTAVPCPENIAPSVRRMKFVLPDDLSGTIDCSCCKRVLPADQFCYARRTQEGKIVRTSRMCRSCLNIRKREKTGGKVGSGPPTTHPDPWARDLYLQALKAFDLARSEITEEDYA